MKLMLIVYSGDTPDLVPRLLDRHGVSGWTEIAGAHGAGTTGRHEGTRAWPGEARLYFSAVPSDKADPLAHALGGAANELPPGERLHVTVMPVETFI